MNNLTINQTKTPFSFLTIQPAKTYSSNCQRAWCYDQFHLERNNYYLYSCHSGNKHRQISKGKQPLEVFNWGGQNV